MIRLLAIFALFVLPLTAYQAFGRPDANRSDAPGPSVQPKACISSQPYADIDVCYREDSADEGNLTSVHGIFIGPITHRYKFCPYWITLPDGRGLGQMRIAFYELPVDGCPDAASGPIKIEY